MVNKICKSLLNFFIVIISEFVQEKTLVWICTTISEQQWYLLYFLGICTVTVQILGNKHVFLNWQVSRLRTGSAPRSSSSNGCVAVTSTHAYPTYAIRDQCPLLSLLLLWKNKRSSPATHTCAVCYLVRFIEEHTKVGEHHPKLLPPVAVFEFS